jgi:hypothetical protein
MKKYNTPLPNFYDRLGIICIPASDPKEGKYIDRTVNLSSEENP